MNNKEQPPLEFSAHYELFEENNLASSAEARLALDEESLGVMPEGGAARRFSLREITDLTEADYRLTLILPENSRVILSRLGRDYENFRRELSSRRSALLLGDLLMEEPLVMGSVRAEFVRKNPEGVESSGQAEIRLYQTAIVVIPGFGTPVRVPFSEIVETSGSDYTFTVKTEYAGDFVFSRLGRDMEPLKCTLSELSQNLSLKVQALVKELMPSADPRAAVRLAGLMKEGRAARRRDIETLGTNLWAELEQRLLSSEAAGEYSYLKSVGCAQDAAVGVKRGLKEGESDYLWFLVPVASTDPRKPGNAVVMEAVSADGESRATYVFRLTGRAAYPNLKTEEALSSEIENFFRAANRALITINFRREPIYLPKEMFLRPQYARYAYSVSAIPELRTLRWLYVGRVIHSSPEQWQADLADLLAFNTSTADDKAQWKKGTG
jgi:hypothetical protein